MPTRKKNSCYNALINIIVLTRSLAIKDVFNEIPAHNIYCGMKLRTTHIHIKWEN